MSSRKTTNILLIVILTLLILAAIFFFFPSKTEAPESVNQVATSTGSTPTFTYTSKTITEENKEKFYSIKSTYPIFALDNGEVQKNLNNNVASLINQQVSSYKSSFDELTTNPDGQYGVSTLSTDFNIKANQNLKNILPLRFDESYYNAGAAHPGAVIITANYDLSSGQPITLASLFKTDASYLDTLSSYSSDALKKKLGDDANISYIEDGTKPKEENFEAFLITDQGLILIFNEYQVAPYAAGAQEITIPYSAMRDILNPNLNLI